MVRDRIVRPVNNIDSMLFASRKYVTVQPIGQNWVTWSAFGGDLIYRETSTEMYTLFQNQI